MKDKFLENILNMTIRDWLHFHQDNVHFHQQYRGLQMMKNPFDLVVYEEMLWDIKPNMIVEIGTAQGGFSLWLRDRMDIIRNEAQIITIDTEEFGKKNLSNFERDNFISIVGDAASDAVISEIVERANGDSILVIEDSSHTYENTLKMLNAYSKIVTKGSYLIVEDGICDILELGISPGPKKAVEGWISSHPEYEIDRTKEKYLITYNPKGFLKRLS